MVNFLFVCYNNFMKKSKIIELVNNEKEKAVVVTVSFSTLKNEDKEYNRKLVEIKRLCYSAECEVVGEFHQNIKKPNVRFLIGEGKLAEIKNFIEENEVDVVIVDHPLTGSQQRNLSNELGVKVLDRILLIIDIFARNSKTNEGKKEVKLAQNKYLLTRLSSMQGSAGRFGGAGVGMRGPGETKLELDKRKLEQEIVELEKEMKKIKQKRQQNRIARIKSGIKRVAVVGYTNAGKSTLLNSFTNDIIYADDKLFATLDTTSRRMYLEDGNYCILTDTVGFISDIPHELVESFSATLEEAVDAELILHVVDVADPFYKDNIEITNKVLDDLNATNNRILVLNKSELLTKPMLMNENEIFISAKHKKGLDNLKKLIIEKLK